MNLRDETLRELQDHERTENDIAWIGGEDFTIPVDKFWELADYEYDGGYGAQHVATDLTIVLKDGAWLERHEYDGSEWWEFKETPKMPCRLVHDVKRVVCRSSMWDTLMEMQDVEDD